MFAVAFEATRGLGLECAENVFEFGQFWFAQEQMDVLGHENVAEDMELVSLPAEHGLSLSKRLHFWTPSLDLASALRDNGDEANGMLGR